MTEMEIKFRSLVQQHTLGQFGYHVSNLRQPGKVYNVILKRLGETEEIPFPVFADQMQNSVLTGKLPEGLLRSFADYFKPPVAQISKRA